MTLTETKDTILRWILSCDREDQVDLLTEVAKEFIEFRFYKDREMVFAMEELNAAMAEQKLIIKRVYFQSLPEQNKKV